MRIMKISHLVAVLTFSILCAPSPALAAEKEQLFQNFQNTNAYKDVVVDRVMSADTILIGEKKIRLIGLKAPAAPRQPKVEYDKNGLPIEKPILPENTFEEKAYAFASHLLLGQRVRIEFDESRTDEDFVTLGYVFLIADGTFANAQILRYGYADLQLKPPNLKYEEDLRDAYREARREKRGLQSN
jgi:micrococcal nuclease